jgi:acetate kinase
MRILVANLGSTSFKFKFLDMKQNGAVISQGGYERIGQAGSPYATHGDVIDVILKQLPTSPDAIGFKAVHGGPIRGAVPVTDAVLDTMQQFADVMPAHNPPYIAAMKAFRHKLPGVPQVAAFETAFHQTIPAARQVYAIPHQWTEEWGIRRYGFHGASHRFASWRIAELAGSAKRIINCHLGGSSSLCAIQDGKSVATSMGLTAQSGIPQNNRCGDFDAFAFLKLTRQGLSVEEIIKKLSREGGLLGISGVSNDMRDIEKAAAEGNKRAQLAIDVFVSAVRHYIGAFLSDLNGCDVLSFTGGIGENGIALRSAICRGFDYAGIKLDETKNNVRGKEARIDAIDSKVQIWILQTNEELVVAKLTQEVLTNNQQPATNN